MINEFKIFKPKDRSIPMERIKEIFKQFGLLCFTVSDDTGFLTREPNDVRFEKVYYEKNNSYGTRLTWKKNGRTMEDSIFFDEHDLVEWLYQNSNEIRKGKKVLENYFTSAKRFLNE